MKRKLIILYGGRSAEREVSVMSAKNIINAARENFELSVYFISQKGDFYFVKDSSNLMTNQSLEDEAKVLASEIYEEKAIVFPVLHGPMGEDGSIQGFLEILKMPYIGPNILSASVTMDKILAKLVFESIAIPQVPYIAAFAHEDKEKIAEKVVEKLKFPVFVKPANMGSSVGISRVKVVAELNTALDKAFKYDRRLVIEEGITDLREIECGMLGDEVSLVGEVIQEAEFYDYNSKYIAAQTVNQVPADLSKEQLEKIQNYAKQAYTAVNGTGLSRCDFFINKKDGEIYLNEINSIPGATAYSMYPSLWEASGVKYADVVQRLADLAQEAFELRESHLL